MSDAIEHLDGANPVAGLGDYVVEFIDRLREEHEDETHHLELGDVAIMAEVIVTDEEGNELVFIDGLSSLTSEWQQVGLLRGAIKSIEGSNAQARRGGADE